MVEPPRITVVIPCYNGGAFLPGALESLCRQTFRDFEVVVVDDGSDDPATLAVLATLDEGVRLLRQENRGLAAARNAGIAAAHGAFVLPLDCDDRLEPTFLARTLAALEGHPEAAFAFSHLKLEGERTGTLAKDYNTFTQLFLNQLPYALLMRRGVWQAAGGYDEAMREGYEDWEFNIRLARKGLAGMVVAEPLFRYHVSNAGMLKAVANRRHAQLWRRIQAKHAELYRPRALVALWWRWRGRPAAYPALLLAGLLVLHRLLPVEAFNRLFAHLLRLSASARAGAGEGT